MMAVDSTATDQEVWQVMSGVAEPRFDLAASAVTAETQGSATTTFGSMNRNASWANPATGESWGVPGANNSSRVWSQARLETDDASSFGEGSLSSMMRSIASEGMAADRTFGWGASGKPGGAVTAVAQDAGNRWNGLASNSSSRDQSAFGPFAIAADGWGCLVGSTAGDQAKSGPGWDIADVEKKPDAAQQPQVGCDRSDSLGKWPPPKSELSESHSRSSSTVVVSSQEMSGSASDGGSMATQPSVSATSTSVNVTDSSSSLIEKLINSNEGWGKRPVRQDVPWVMDDVAEPTLTSTEAGEAANKDTTQNISTMGSIPESQNAGVYWGDIPARAPAIPVDFGADSDIGMWNGPPDAAGSGQLLGLPKDGGWHGISSLGLANQPGVGAVPQQPLATVPPLGLASHLLETGNCPGVPASFIDVMQRELAGAAKDGLQRDVGWAQMLGTQRQNSAVDAMGVGLGGVQVGPLDNNWRSTAKGQISPSSTLQKIGNWNEPAGGAGNVPGQGFWNQPPPAMPGYSNQLQQLQGGMKKDEALHLAQPQRGRMLRGQSTGEVGNMGMLFADSAGHGALPSGRASAFQPVFNSSVPPPMHRKQQSAGGGAGWVGAGFPQYGNAPNMSPASIQRLLELQTILQPLLNERSNVQQSRSMTAMQRRQALDRLNPIIDTVKRQMDQIQVASSGVPQIPHPSEMPSNITDMMQLMGRLRLEQEAGAMPMPSGELRNPGIGSPGTDIFAGAWMGAGAPAGSVGSQFGWPEPVDTTGFSRGLRGMAVPNNAVPQQFGGVNPGGRSSLWSPQFVGGSRASGSDKIDAAAGKNSGNTYWLKLSNISSQLEGPFVQILCSQCGALTTFLFNKTTSQALAYYASLDDTRRACQTLNGAGNPGSMPLMSSEIVTFDVVCQMIDGPAAAGWMQLPPAMPAAQGSVFGKP